MRKYRVLLLALAATPALGCSSSPCSSCNQGMLGKLTGLFRKNEPVICAPAAPCCDSCVGGDVSYDVPLPAVPERVGEPMSLPPPIESVPAAKPTPYVPGQKK